MPSLLQRIEARAERGPLFWVATSLLIALQMLAFYLLCSQQVRKAEARMAEVQVEWLAIHDCLEYVSDSTIGGCKTRIAPSRGADQPSAAGGDTATVSFIR